MAYLLIVDDDEGTVEALAEVFAAEGHRIRVAHDGLEGLARLKEAPTDATLPSNASKLTAYAAVRLGTLRACVRGARQLARGRGATAQSPREA